MKLLGRKYSELYALACDIIECCEGTSPTDYVLNCMIPAAEQAIEMYGDDTVQVPGGEYSYSSVTNRAFGIAQELENTGMIILED